MPLRLQHKRLVQIIRIVIIIAVVISGMQFRGTVVAGSENASSPSSTSFQDSITTNGGNVLYLPVMANNYPWISPFGAESTKLFLTGSTILTRATELNIGWTRMGVRISWRALQPNPGDDINWGLLASFEEELRNLRAANITPVVVVYDSPHWAVIPNIREDNQPTSCGPIAEDYFDEFAGFMRQLVKRYKTPEFNLHTWEIGNEIDVDPDLVPVDSGWGCWGDIDDTDFYGGRHYGKMLKYVTPVIKKEDPFARVWLGGLLLATPETQDESNGKPENFLRGVLEEGAAPYFDIVAYHAHLRYYYYDYGEFRDVDTDAPGPWEPWGGGVLGKAEFLRAIMDEYNVQKDLVQGEIGIGCEKKDEEPECEPLEEQFYQYQADMLVRVAVRVASDDHVQGISWYTLDGPGWRDQGLLDASYNPRPSFDAYQNLTQRLVNTKYLNEVDYGPGIEAYAFRRGSEEVRVVWSIKDQENKILVPQADFVEYYERDGTRVDNPPLNGGNYEILVDFSPIFLILQAP